MSRPLSSSVQTEIAKLSGARPRTLFELELEGGTIRYTDHHENLTFDSETYYARQIKHTAIKSYMENRVDNTTIEINNVDKALSAYFASEDFQGRKVKIKKIFLGLTAAEDFILQFEGWMEAPKLNQGRASIKCTNKFDRSESKSPWRRFGIRCNWDFCGTECAYNSPYGKQTGTADSGTVSTAVDMALPSRADDYWKGAKFTVTGGTNRGRWRYVDSYNDTAKELTFLVTFPEAIDDTTQYVLECDKARGTCETFGNESQFDGFDEILSFDASLPKWGNIFWANKFIRDHPEIWSVPKFGADIPIPIVYGESLVPGVLLDEYRDAQTSDRIYGICAGEIDSISKMHVNGVAVTGFNAYTGTSAQSFSFHGETKYYRRTAVVQMNFIYAIWGDDSSVVFEVKGLKVQKYLANGTRDGSPAWSDNPIWCLLDYLMNRAAEPTPAADIDFAAFKAAADDCDTLGYTISMKLISQEKDAKIIDRFLIACRGYRTYYGGKMGVHVEQAASSSHSFDMDNIRKGSFSYERMTPNDVPNRVIVTYTDTEVRKVMAMASATVLKNDTSIPYKNASGSFATATPSEPKTAYLGGESFTYTGNTGSSLTGCSARANDYPGGYPIFQGNRTFPELTAIWNDYDNQASVKRVIEKKVDGAAIPTYSHAYKMAEFIGRKGMDCNLFADLTGLMDSLGLTVGDRVSLDHDVPGWTGAAFRVVEASESMEEEVKYLLRYYDATIYEENTGMPASPIQTSLPSPFDAPPHVTNLAVTESIQILADGTARAVLLISFDEPTGDDAIFWHHADIFYTTDNWATTQYYGSFNDGDEVPPMPVEKGTGTTYKFKAVSVSTKDVSADIAYAPEQTKAPSFDTTAPAAPTGLAATAIVAGLRLDWTNPSDKDFLGVQIFRNTTDSFPGGVPYACVAGEPGKAGVWTDRGCSYAQIYYFWLKGVDRSGNASSETSSVYAIAGMVESLDIAKNAIDLAPSLSFREIFEGVIADIEARWTNYGGSGERSIQSGGLTGGQFLRVGDNSGDDMVRYIGNRSIPFDPGKLYRIKCRIRQTAGAGTCYIGVAGRNAGDTGWVATNGTNTTSGQYYCAASAKNPGASWVVYTGYFKGTAATGEGGEHTDPSDPALLHDNVRYIRPYIIVNYIGVAGTFEIDEISIEIMSEDIGTAQIRYASIIDAHIVSLSAKKITTDALRSINSFSAKYSTKGTYLTQACSGGATILYLENTDDIPLGNGSGWIIDGSNDRNAFSWTDKTSNSLYGCSGVLAHSAGALVIPASKAIFIDDAVNEMRFFGDRGDGTVEELASIGIKQAGTDYVIIDVGSSNPGNSRTGIRAVSYDAGAIHGASVNSYGVEGKSTNDVGVVAIGGKSPILLTPSASASAPSHAADKGSLWVTSEGKEYINVDGNTTWLKKLLEFGAWGARAVNAVYQAAGDGFVVAYGYSVSMDSEVVGYTDATNPPTTIRCRDKAAAGYYCSITLPVKEGNYYKITGNGIQSISAIFTQ